MRRLLAAAGSVLALSAASPCVHAGEWTRLESEHFSVITNRDGKMVRDHLQQLERFRWLGLKVLGADDKGLRAQGRFDIVLLRGQASLREIFPAMDKQAAGVYSTCEEGSASYATYETGRGDRNIMVLQHEYAHHLMFQYATIAYPEWYVEGFAEYMSTFESGDEIVSLGGTYQERLLTLTNPRWGSWLPMERVLRWRMKDSPADSADETLVLYAQSWLLTHYMFSDDERAKKLPAYFARVAAGEDPVAAFEPATGIAVADLVKQLKRYLRDSLPMVQVRGRDMPQTVIQAVSMSDAADIYMPKALPLLACVKPEHGQAILEQLRSLAGKPVRAEPALRLELARAEVRFGDASVAIALLDELIAADASNAEARYLLGRAWERKAQSSQGEERAAAQERARSEFFAAYRLRKNHAPTLYHLALALAREGATPNALNASRAARTLAPLVQGYAELEARLDLQAGDRERAMRALAALASNQHSADTAARARLAIEAIQAGKSVQDVEAIMKPDPQKAIQ